MNSLDAIRSENIDEIIDSMHQYAMSELKSVGVKDFNGKQPIDFVGDLILKVIEGTRDWNKADCSFKEFLFGCLKSEISNFFKAKKRHVADESPSIPVNGHSINFEETKSKIVELLKVEGADDDELQVFECWLDGIYKPAKIASELGIPVERVYVVIKRLERKRKKIMQKAIIII
ncbi:MAG: sigma-70 family RNA polymerase sigma factor [Lacibacter sp.]|jgi:DNA-directed RNA polymerase specialized sigma24 family protein